MKTLTAGFASALALSFFGLSLQAETLHWRGTSSELASVAANWSPEQVPTAADDIVLDADSANKPLTWDLDSGVASWTQSGYTGTVTFKTGTSISGSPCYGVETGVMAGEKGLPITENLTLLSGTWTHAEQPAFNTSALKGTDNYKQGYAVYRIIVSVGGSCTVGSDARIDVDGKGFAGSSGPGYSNSCASHGGFGGYNYVITTAPGAIYGSYRQPISQGSGRDTRGGGAVKLSVVGALALDGTITSIGPRTGNYVGAGGSIWLTAESLTGSGILCANGGAGKISAGCGGGGRVAVHLTGDNADFSNFTGEMTAKNTSVYGSCGTVYRETKADAGAGELILVSGNTSSSTPKFYENRLNGTLLKPDVTGAKAFAFKKISLGQWTRFNVTDGLTVTVGAVEGHSSGSSSLLLNGAVLNVPEGFRHDKFCLASYGGSATVNVGASQESTYVLCPAGSMCLDSPATLVSSLVVSGVVTHTAQSAAVPAYTNRLDLTVVGDMTIASGGDVTVTLKGFPASAGPGGSATKSYGAVYGGVVPGSDKNVYGSILHPTDSGSSGTVGGAPGAVKLTVGGKLTVASGGYIHAHGNYNNGGSNASGGSIWLMVGEIAGSGEVEVRGGTYAGSTVYPAAGGSGGRIAVRQTKGNVLNKDCTVRFDLTGGKSTGGSSSGSGTLYWETADDGLDKGVVSIGNNQLPPEGMPADELTNATIQVSAKSTLTLLDDAYVGQFNLPADATLKLSGHTLHVLNPTRSYSRSIKGTVDDSEGGSIEWPRKGLVLMVR